LSNLIKQLKKEHAEILDTLSRVKDFGISTKEGREKLLSSKINLLKNLNTEDEQLYPALKKAAEYNDILKKKLDIFAKDMEEISKQAIRFFEKYSTGGSGAEFAKEFGILYATIEMRIKKEEEILFKEYEKLSQ